MVISGRATPCCRGSMSKRNEALCLGWLPAPGLMLDHFSEGILELCGHTLLEQCEQRLGGQGSERVDGVDDLIPVIVGLTGPLEGLPQLSEVEPRERP